MTEETKLPEIDGALPADDDGQQPLDDLQMSNARQNIHTGGEYSSNRGSQSHPPGGMGGGKSHFVAKKERQDVERDAQLLANRIALLKQEEMKTWKKIEETKKRAGEVMRLKERNNVRIAEKMEKMKYDQMVSN